MDGIERGEKIRVQSQRIRTDELVRIVRLIVDVDAHHLKTRLPIALGRAAGAAEEVQESKLVHLNHQGMGLSISGENYSQFIQGGGLRRDILAQNKSPIYWVFTSTNMPIYEESGNCCIMCRVVR